MTFCDADSIPACDNDVAIVLAVVFGLAYVAAIVLAVAERLDPKRDRPDAF